MIPASYVLTHTKGQHMYTWKCSQMSVIQIFLQPLNHLDDYFFLFIFVSFCLYHFFTKKCSLFCIKCIVKKKLDLKYIKYELVIQSSKILTEGSGQRTLGCHNHTQRETFAISILPEISKEQEYDLVLPAGLLQEVAPAPFLFSRESPQYPQHYQGLLHSPGIVEDLRNKGIILFFPSSEKNIPQERES